jgi:hypothetical protein
MFAFWSNYGNDRISLNSVLSCHRKPRRLVKNRTKKKNVQVAAVATNIPENLQGDKRLK